MAAASGNPQKHWGRSNRSDRATRPQHRGLQSERVGVSSNKPPVTGPPGRQIASRIWVPGFSASVARALEARVQNARKAAPDGS